MVTKAEEMKLQEIKERVAKGEAVLVDVRELDEWNKSHLKIAVSLPLSAIVTGKIPPTFPFDKKLYIHCAFGSRVQTAQNLLKTFSKDPEAVMIEYSELAKFFN